MRSLSNRWTIVGVVVAVILAAVLLTPLATSAHPAAQGTVQSNAAVALNQAMRKLWEEHVTWTRVVIISFDAGLPDYNTAVGRLLQNQVDIGNAIKPYYGDAAGNQLTALLREHILLAAALLADAKSGNTTQFAIDNAAWYANADAIAAFLHNANPKYWPLDEMTQMMHRHLDLTLQEATARLQGNWAADVTAYDAVENEILGMADLLSQGIVKQFPRRFH